MTDHEFVDKTGASDAEWQERVAPFLDWDVETVARRLQMADPDGIRMAATDLPPAWDDPHVDREHYLTFATALLGVLLAEQESSQ